MPPTILEAAGLPEPTEVNGTPQAPWEREPRQPLADRHAGLVWPVELIEVDAHDAEASQRSLALATD